MNKKNIDTSDAKIVYGGLLTLNEKDPDPKKPEDLKPVFSWNQDYLKLCLEYLAEEYNNIDKRDNMFVVKENKFL